MRHWPVLARPRRRVAAAAPCASASGCHQARLSRYHCTVCASPDSNECWGRQPSSEAIFAQSMDRSGYARGTLAPRVGMEADVPPLDPRALLTSVGIAPPKTTDAQALGKVKFGGNWAFDNGAIRIDPFSLDFDETHFTGSFSRTAGADALGPQPVLAGRGGSGAHPLILPGAPVGGLALPASGRHPNARDGDLTMHEKV